MKVKTAGSSGWNEGKISLLPDAAGSTFTAAGVPTTTAIVLASLETTTNQTLMAIYTVPLTYTAYLLKSYANCADNNVIEVSLYARPDGEVFQVKEKFHVYRNSGEVSHEIPVPYSAGTDLELRAAGSTSAADVSGGFDLLLCSGD